MKTAHFLCCTLLCAGMLYAEDAVTASITPDRQALFKERFDEALRAYFRDDLAKAQALITQAEQIQPGTALLANFRGGILFDQGRYAEASTWFYDALKLDPLFYPARINLADIEFRAGHYPKARSAYRVLLSEDPKSESLLYRIFLTFLLEKNDAEAKTALAAIPFPGDTPAYYFANGAWCFAHGNETEARGWIEPGISIFGSERSTTFAEPLVFLGWLRKDFRPPNALLANPPAALELK